MNEDAKSAAEAARQARLAAALRANLQRRKARDRAVVGPMEETDQINSSSRA